MYLYWIITSNGKIGKYIVAANSKEKAAEIATARLKDKCTAERVADLHYIVSAIYLADTVS